MSHGTAGGRKILLRGPRDRHHDVILVVAEADYVVATIGRDSIDPFEWHAGKYFPHDRSPGWQLKALNGAIAAYTAMLDQYPHDRP